MDPKHNIAIFLWPHALIQNITKKKYVDGRHLNNTREILHGGYFMFFGQVCQKLSAFGAWQNLCLKLDRFVYLIIRVVFTQ